ncbi:hypothetical protein H5410_046361 [Solanum commersonii]|uniref:Putative plant transposon protein domain-containing protein n=1 Tax=Solanum commersonii TaxID=4109 RepID=A0A9J5XE80_SOLCO|nr:hypothetical protein H5410_046361 [Solanum commersonii]
MNKKPRLMRPLAQSQYHYQGMRILLQCEEIVWEFYASYATPLRGSISKKSKPIAQDPLASTMVSDGISCEAALSRGMLTSERVSPTKADNQLPWDRVVMVATLVVGGEIEFSHMLLAEIHERAFKNSTTYPFPCLISQLCRDFGVPICNSDRLTHTTGTLDIGFILDKANVAAPRREPQVEVPPLGADLADTVGQAQGSDPIMPDHTDTIPTSSSQAASRAPSLSQSTLPLELLLFHWLEYRN